MQTAQKSETQQQIFEIHAARRADTWRIARPWIVLAVTAFVGFFTTVGMNPNRDGLSALALGLMIVSSLVVVGSFARVALVLQKYYRCPACDSPLVRGVEIDPAVCPVCKARLR